MFDSSVFFAGRNKVQFRPFLVFFENICRTRLQQYRSLLCCLCIYICNYLGWLHNRNLSQGKYYMLQRAQAGDLTKWWKLWTLRDMECIFIDRTLAGSMSVYFIFTSASKAYQGIVQFFEFSEIANDKNVIKINIYIVQTFGIKIHFKLENFPRVENQNFYGIARNIGEEKN